VGNHLLSSFLQESFGKETGDKMLWFYFAEFGSLFSTDFLCNRAAGTEAATGWRIGRRGNIALEDDAFSC
jgi:hypothetical protein